MDLMRIPILPIPNAVFFSNTALPLYVEDPMYIRMVKECIDNNTLVGVSLAIPLNEILGIPIQNPNTAQYTPKRICSVGTPVLLEEFSSKCIKILIKGVDKIELISLYQSAPYPLFEAKIIPIAKEHILPTQEYQMKRLTGILKSWLQANISDTIERESFIGNLSSIYHVVDYICMFLIKDIHLRQSLLECDSIIERIYLLNALLPNYSPFKEDPNCRDSVLSFEHIEKSSLMSC